MSWLSDLCGLPLSLLNGGNSGSGQRGKRRARLAICYFAFWMAWGGGIVGAGAILHDGWAILGGFLIILNSLLSTVWTSESP